jgi:hypothetical protein
MSGKANHEEYSFQVPDHWPKGVRWFSPQQVDAARLRTAIAYRLPKPRKKIIEVNFK